MEIVRSVDLIFPTPLTIIQFDDLDFFKKFAKLIYNGLTETNLAELEKRKVWTTSDDLHIDDKFTELVTLIDSEAQQFFKDYLGLESLTMSCMWSNIQINGFKHHLHQHPNSFYSGVIYLDVPEGDEVNPGNIFFTDPRPAKNMFYADYAKQNPLSDRGWWVTPKIGGMILFPSWLEHGTELCILEENTQRVSLSFNYRLNQCSEPTMKI